MFHSVTRDLPDRGVEPFTDRHGLAVSERVSTGLQLLALVPGDLTGQNVVSDKESQTTLLSTVLHRDRLSVCRFVLVSSRLRETWNSPSDPPGPPPSPSPGPSSDLPAGSLTALADNQLVTAFSLFSKCFRNKHWEQTRSNDRISKTFIAVLDAEGETRLQFVSDIDLFYILL